MFLCLKRNSVSLFLSITAEKFLDEHLPPLAGHIRKAVTLEDVLQVGGSVLDALPGERRQLVAERPIVQFGDGGRVDVAFGDFPEAEFLQGSFEVLVCQVVELQEFDHFQGVQDAGVEEFQESLQKYMRCCH